MALAVSLAAAAPALGAETRFAVDPEAGNNTFTAVFDAAIGERITAVSSAVSCTLVVDEEKLEGKASCSVPLTSIRVDNDDTKSDHFRQWSTNKKVDPKKCAFKLELPHVKVPPPVEAMKPVEFDADGTFTLCGRPRDDKGTEAIHATAIYLPPGSYKDVRTLRIRARVDGFNRERYKVGPAFTSGWLARVQQLAPVVATEGTIDVNLFATAPAATPPAASEPAKP
jgi:hypothetical protein